MQPQHSTGSASVSQDGAHAGEQPEQQQQQPAHDQTQSSGRTGAPPAPSFSQQVTTSAPSVGGTAGAGPSGSRPGRRCRVPGCSADLTTSKTYNWRYRICEVHRGSSSVTVDGRRCRFCQMCAKFHELEEFEGTKMSCRRKLQEHNLRRRIGTAAKLSASAKAQPAGQGPTSHLPYHHEDHLALHRQQQQQQQPYHPTDAYLRPPLVHPAVSAPLPDAGPNTAQLLQALATIVQVVNGRPQQQQQPPPAWQPTPGAFTGFGPLNAPSQQQQPQQPALPATETLNLLAAALNCLAPGPQGPPAAPPPPPPPPQPPGLLSVILQQQQRMSQGSSAGGPSIAGLSIEEIIQALLPVVTGGAPLAEAPAAPPQPPPHNHDALPAAAAEPPPAPAQPDTATAAAATAPLPAAQAAAPSASGQSSEPGAYSSEERLVRMSVKMFGCEPSQLASGVVAELASLLETAPAEVESYVRPGCAVVTFDVRVASHSGFPLSSADATRMAQMLLPSSARGSKDGAFVVQLGSDVVAASGVEQVGGAEQKMAPPALVSVRPLCVVAGSGMPVTLRGRHIAADGALQLCRQHGVNVALQGVGSSHPTGDTWALPSQREAGTFHGEAVTLCPLGLVPGCAEFEVERGPVLSVSLPLLVLPPTACASAAAAELAQLEHEGAASRFGDVSQFLRDVGAVVRGLGSQAPDAAHAKRAGAMALRLVQVAEARGWKALAQLLRPAAGA